MKKILIASLMLGMVAIVAPSVEAKPAAAAVTADPQVRVQIGNNRNRRWNRGARSVIRTRIVRVGRYRYRETIRVTYLPNGRTRTHVISRVRIGRGYIR